LKLIKKSFPQIKITGVSEAGDLLSRKKIFDFFTREDAYTSNRLLDFKAVDPNTSPPTPLPFTFEKIISPGDVEKFVSNFYVDYDDYRKTFETLCALKPKWICPGHCGAYGGEEAVQFMAGSRRELDWITDYVTDRAQSQEGITEAAEVAGESIFPSPTMLPTCGF